MLRIWLSFSVAFLMITPVLAQHSVSGSYNRRYKRQYSTPSTSASDPTQQTADPLASQQSTFSGRPSPSNLPDPSMKGFGQQSHWLDRPGASRNTTELSGQVDALVAKITQAKSSGDLPGPAQANAALQNLLRQLTSMEPKEAKWKVLKATTYINQAGGPSRSGTAGDRFSLQQAIRELDMAAACPNADQYRSQIASMRASTDAELNKRIEKGKEIQRRGARQFAEIYNMKGGDNSGTGGPSWCTVCGKMHSSGQCGYRRD